MSPPKAPENLPPGLPVFLDVAWVPGYLIRVPFDQAVAFFHQFRARVYVLSGECLHPITGEALISGISSWTDAGMLFFLQESKLIDPSFVHICKQLF